MATFGQIAHAIQDFSKTISDDAIINIDHIIFLMSKYRNYLLSNPTVTLTDADYQTVCVDVAPDYDESICGTKAYLVSSAALPRVMERGSVTVSPPAGFRYNYRFQFVNYQKFQFVGHNRWLSAFSYITIGPDGRLYLTSSKHSFMYLRQLKVTALFDDIEKAGELECDDSCKPTVCDIEDREFPLQAKLIPLLMKYVTTEITAAAWQPRDDQNNANDDLSEFARALQLYTNNAFKRKMRGAETEVDNA